MTIAVHNTDARDPFFSRGKGLLSQITDKRLSDYVVPSLLAALIAVLGWIGLTLMDMNKTLAVAVFRIDVVDNTERSHHADTERRLDAHDRRLETLETQRYKAGMK